MRLLRQLMWVVGIMSVAASALAQTSGGSTPVEGGGAPCVCGTTLDGADVCWQDNLCQASINCDAANPCASGYECIVNECCNNSPTLGKCLAVCPDGGNCQNPGVCGTFDLFCLSSITAVPTVSYLGLGVLLILLVAAAVWAMRRRRLSAA